MDIKTLCCEVVVKTDDDVCETMYGVRVPDARRAREISEVNRSERAKRMAEDLDGAVKDCLLLFSHEMSRSIDGKARIVVSGRGLATAADIADVVERTLGGLGYSMERKQSDVTGDAVFMNVDCGMAEKSNGNTLIVERDMS